MEEQGNPATSSAISSQPLITTSTSKKSAKKVLFKSSPSSTSSLASSLHAVQPLQAVRALVDLEPVPIFAGMNISC